MKRRDHQNEVTDMKTEDTRIDSRPIPPKDVREAQMAKVLLGDFRRWLAERKT